MRPWAEKSVNLIRWLLVMGIRRWTLFGGSYTTSLKDHQEDLFWWSLNVQIAKICPRQRLLLSRPSVKRTAADDAFRGGEITLAALADRAHPETLAVAFPDR